VLDRAVELPSRVPEAVATLERCPPTLIHADLHLDNVLFLEDGTPVILDWPSACSGAPALDVGRLLTEGMTTKARHDRQDRLLERYLAILRALGGEYEFDRLQADIVCTATLLYAAAVRWATGPHAAPAGIPRVPLLVESLLSRAAEASMESWDEQGVRRAAGDPT
jgi:Ser/Thr protein kinase RdoA (MazF antagonist)